MSTICEILELMNKVKAEKKRQFKELKKIEKTDTIFNKHKKLKLVHKAKIETLNDVEKWLNERLKTAMLMNEIEL